jgi:hypothetical protein
MTIYTAYFRTDAETACHEFEARTPKQALALARKFYNENPLGLYFEPYDGGMPVNEIAISDADDNECAVWFDDDLRLRLAASDLHSALLAVMKWWTQTPAFQNGEDEMPAEIFDAMRLAVAKAKGGAA